MESRRLSRHEQRQLDDIERYFDEDAPDIASKFRVAPADQEPLRPGDQVPNLMLAALGGVFALVGALAGVATLVFIGMIGATAALLLPCRKFRAAEESADPGPGAVPLG